MSAMVSSEVGSCFHCGLALQTQVFPVVIDEVIRPTCCRGCQAVAQTIMDSGLGAYYRTRSSLPSKPQEAGEVIEQLALYDLPEVQRTFVQSDAATHEKEAALLLEGITCAACAWLIEQRLSRVHGVCWVGVNFASRRARIRWDERETQLSTLLTAVEALGFHAHPYDATRADDALRCERRGLLWRLFIAGFSMMQVMMYAVPVYLAHADMSADIEQLMRIAGLLLTAPVVAWAATPFYRGALRELTSRRVGMDVPIAVAILVAFGASALSTLSGAGEVYFDSVTMFVFLLLAARYLELVVRSRATDSQERLARLAPALTERLDRFPDTRKHEQVATASLRAGDIVLVRPGAVIPADAIVIDGHGAADESLLTGESRSVIKAPGDRLIGGALNKHSPLIARVERIGEASHLASIMRLMDRAQMQKPRIALAADRAARAFAAFVLVLCVIAALAWYWIEPARALWITIAILVVSCPCALSLATPAALTAATGALYRRGVLVTRGHALETLAKATHYVFDKTGTLTSGELTFVGVMPLGERTREECMRIAAALEARSEHPIGKAIVAAAATQATLPVSDLEHVTGRGIEGRVEDVRVRIGTPEFVSELHGQSAPDLLSLISDEVSVVALGDEHGWVALLTFGDTVRRDARRLVAQLKARGATVCLLSGDREARVQRLARELGIAITRAQALPCDKVEFVQALQREGAVVAMIGDGVNDAPVLAQAQVSIALASGAELAQNSADIILMGAALSPLMIASSHARSAMRVVRQNLAWAAIYNVVALPLAAAGMVTPLLAAVGMSLSSLLVVANALRLLHTAGDDAAMRRMPLKHRSVQAQSE
ncbi:MAG TPA: heavy metal translocating P-type ATPase [Burkholderiales bacterium]|nr:heavy metal translocating P-type ATPase [Burkholderiales bacterium]